MPEEKTAFDKLKDLTKKVIAAPKQEVDKLQKEFKTKKSIPSVS